MNRIWFASDEYVPSDDFKGEMNLNGVSVEGGTIPGFIPDKDTLICVDNHILFEQYPDSLIVISDTKELDLYKGAKYFVMNPEECDLDYFVKIWQRLRGIPWEIAVTERLRIRETIEEDVDFFFEIYKDPEMTRYNEKLYENPEEEKKYAREYREKVYEVQGFGIWTVIEKETDTVIGRAGLISRGGFDDVEVGFLIGTKYQGKGYATEAVKACLDVAAKMEFSRVYALVMPGNEPSFALLKKLGFKKNGEEKVNGVLYEIWCCLLS